VLTGPELDARRDALPGSPDLSALVRRLTEQAAPLIERRPAVPSAKALLSADGGVCPDDGAALVFDPWSPSQHRCPRCARSLAGERHDRAWARYQHLWLVERAATLAAVAALTGHAAAAEAAGGILGEYGSVYFQCPNSDNVLGPSRLFFSTYLESIWLTNYLAAASLLRESSRLGEGTAATVNAVADEAANLIGEFDEGFSNRQTWHNAALAAVAVWFEDEELATRVVEGPTGVLAHLLQGFRHDGMWYEGENYHLFALRGQLLAMGWVRQAGVDLLADARLARQLAAALRAPALSAMPDRTFPARKDSRFGVSLAQPMYLELWEVGLARLGDSASELWGWLRELYSSPALAALPLDSYLHEAGHPAPPAPRTRADLSWWALLEMSPALPESTGWTPGDELLESQGLAILRTNSRYASLECGPTGGGHGHADRLHLTLFANGQPWLVDPGAGSYVARDLFWYRSTLAHNAPRLDGASQAAGAAFCAAFDSEGAWSWTRGIYGPLTRTLVAGPRYLLDVVELASSEARTLELPWHLHGRVETLSAGRWIDEGWREDFVAQAERFVPAGPGPIALRATGEEGATLTLQLLFDGSLLRAHGPGRPGDTTGSPFYLVRAEGRNPRLITLLEPAIGSAVVRSLSATGDQIEVETAGGTERHVATLDGWELTAAEGAVRLGGLRRDEPPAKPLIDHHRPTPMHAVAAHVVDPPPLDGSLDGFDAGAPIVLDHEDQYRRSEEPYQGPEELSATVLANWDGDALYLGVDVVKPDLVVRPSDALPLRLDNEPDDIHTDGVQVYLRPEAGGPVYGFLAALADGGRVRARVTSDAAGEPDMVAGSWRPTEAGYSLSLAITVPGWHVRGGDEIGFDILVNEMRPGRLRRAGQLVWSGGGGWVYLRGDRQPDDRFGILELQ